MEKSNSRYKNTINNYHENVQKQIYIYIAFNLSKTDKLMVNRGIQIPKQNNNNNNNYWDYIGKQKKVLSIINKYKIKSKICLLVNKFFIFNK